MAFAIRGTGSIITAAGSGSTMTLPVTTNLGDTVIIVGCMNSTSTITGSGAGATWVNYNVGAGPSVSACIGYNASAGQTTCVATTGGLGDYAVFVCSGLTATNPVIRTVSGIGSTNNTPFTTSAMAYEGASSVLLAVCGTYSNSASWSSVPGSWTATGATDTQIYEDTNSSQRVFWASYALPSGGSSTTYTTPNPGSTQLINGVYIFDLALAGVTAAYVPPSKVIRQAVNRAATFFRRESGLYEPERGLVVPSLLAA